jgi:hypothetical protein
MGSRLCTNHLAAETNKLGSRSSALNLKGSFTLDWEGMKHHPGLAEACQTIMVSKTKRIEPSHIAWQKFSKLLTD